MFTPLHALNSATGPKQNRLLRYASCKFDENLLIGRYWRSIRLETVEES